MTTAATPRQLAARSILGSWLIFFMFPLSLLCVSFLGSIRSQTGSHLFFALLWRLGIMISPAIAGVIFTQSSEKKLRLGIMEDRWSEAEISEARGWLERPIFSIVNYALALFLIAFVALFFFGGLHATRGFSPFTYIFIVPTATRSRLKTMLAKPTAHKPWLDWSTIKPLHSDNWGRSY